MKYKINIASTPIGSKAIQEFIDKLKVTFQLPPGLLLFEDLEQHEARYRTNLQCRDYQAAKHHLIRVIQIKVDSILENHCKI